MNLSSRLSLKLLLAPTTAATGATTGETVDLSGHDGCMFVLPLGTNAGTVTMQIQESSASTAGFDALTEAVKSSSAGGSDSLMVIDVYRPLKRYYRALVTRGSTDTAELGGVIAMRYKASKEPTTHDSTSLSGGSVVLAVAPTT